MLLDLWPAIRAVHCPDDTGAGDPGPVRPAYRPRPRVRHFVEEPFDVVRPARLALGFAVATHRLTFARPRAVTFRPTLAAAPQTLTWPATHRIGPAVHLTPLTVVRPGLFTLTHPAEDDAEALALLLDLPEGVLT